MQSEPNTVADAVPDQRRRPRQAAAAVPVRQDQRAEVRQTPRRRRRHRPRHGQPHRRARPAGDREALRGGPRRAQPPLLRQQRPAQPAPRGRPALRPACTASSSTPTRKSSPASARRKSSATCAWPCSGRATPPIVPAPSFPIHVYAVALASGNVISLDCTQPDRFLSNVANVGGAPVPPAQGADPQLPAQPQHAPSSSAISSSRWWPWPGASASWCIHDFAYGDVCFDGYRAPSFLSVPGAKEVGVETTTMSKGYNMAGWRLGFCAGNAEMVRALATIKGYYDYGIFQPIQIAGIVALRHGRGIGRAAGAGVPEAARRAGGRPAAHRLGGGHRRRRACSSGRSYPAGVARTAWARSTSR